MVFAIGGWSRVEDFRVWEQARQVMAKTKFLFGV